MKKQQPEPNRRKKLPIDYMPNISNVASNTECTGIVPVQPQSEEELDSYLDLYSTSLPPVWDDEGEEDETP